MKYIKIDVVNINLYLNVVEKKEIIDLELNNNNDDNNNDDNKLENNNESDYDDDENEILETEKYTSTTSP